MYFILPHQYWYSIRRISLNTHSLVFYRDQDCYCKFLFSDLTDIVILKIVHVIQFKQLKNIFAMKKCVEFVTSMMHLRCLKLYFRKKGAWVKYRRCWPYFITAKFGRGHPVRVSSPACFIRRFKRHVRFSNLLFAHIDIEDLSPFGVKFKNLQLLSVYTRRGIVGARDIFIKKQGKVSQYSKFKSRIF